MLFGLQTDTTSREICAAADNVFSSQSIALIRGAQCDAILCGLTHLVTDMLVWYWWTFSCFFLCKKRRGIAWEQGQVSTNGILCGHLWAPIYHQNGELLTPLWHFKKVRMRWRDDHAACLLSSL